MTVDGRRWRRYTSSRPGWAGSTIAHVSCAVYVEPEAVAA